MSGEISRTLKHILTSEPFPTVASADVVCRAGLRALAGWSGTDPFVHEFGEGWPSAEKDDEILLSLRLLSTCAAAVAMQDHNLAHEAPILTPQSYLEWFQHRLSESVAMEAVKLVGIFTRTFFDVDGDQTQTLRSQMVRALEMCLTADPDGNSEERITIEDAAASVSRPNLLLGEPLYITSLDRAEWSNPEDAKQAIWTVEAMDISEGLHQRGQNFSYWSRWFEGFVVGQPLPWDLQREVALIDNAIWEEGPEAVAKKIDEIEARFHLEASLQAAEAEILRAYSQRHGIGGNNPPERIDNLPEIPNYLQIVWEPLATLNDQVEEKEPDAGVIKSAIQKLMGLIAACGKWVSEKLDAATTEFAKSIGKWGGPAFIAWLATQVPQIEKVLSAAKEWLLALLNLA